MRSFVRSLKDNFRLWRVWVPLLLLTIALPPVVLALPLVEKRLIDGVLLPGNLDNLPAYVLLYGGVWFLGSAIGMVNEVLRSYLRESVLMGLRRRLFRHCEILSLAFARQEHSGRTMSLFVNDAPNVSTLVSTTVFVGIGNLIGVLLGALVMISLSWHLALAVLVATPLVGGLATIVTRPLRPASRLAQEKAAELNQQLQENLSGIREVIMFGQGPTQERRLATTLQDLLRLRMRVVFIDTALGAGQTMFYLAATMTILGFGGYLFIEGRITLGALVAMRSFLQLILYPATQLVGLVGSAQKALASSDRVYRFLDRRPDVPERADTRMPDRIEGMITFNHVSFSYRPNQSVLHDVSFSARPGETVAVVGPSGAGKSTLVSLVARAYDPDCGHVMLDGVDLRDLPLEALRQEIGMVFQDTYLFAMSIRDNIAFGCPTATEYEIVEAAKAANAWEFIADLPDRLDTLVGERGVHFSEGQKQRLAIARALLRDPKVLILDEPTSALDARSERLLQDAFSNLMNNRTTFVIAHRLATVQQADLILVLDHGTIVEQGTHEELLLQDGIYRELHDLQFHSTHDASSLSNVPAGGHPMSAR